MIYLSEDDPQLKKIIDDEASRLDSTLNLIAAENHAPESINEVLGSVLNTKTIEGYPGNRFHAGCSMVDEIEKLAIERGKELFSAEYINVQPHSGTSANLAVYFSVLNPGDPVLAMSLPSGGHLSHGHRASITSKCFKFTHYTLDPETERIDYDQINDLAKTIKPRMIVAGASAYPRLIDYRKMSEIAAGMGAFFMTDMAHLAGLVAAKVIPSPVPYSDFVTFTCYKTMMGGRGGIILCKEKFGKKIDSAIFPGCQGTSAVNLIAAKALIFKLAEKDNFVTIQKATINNAKKMAKAFMDKGYRVVTGGTDNHQVLVDLSSTGLSGKAAETVLEQVGIVLNRNVIPKDAGHPGKVSGIRIGTGAVSARGMEAPEMADIVALIDATLKNSNTTEILSKTRSRVADLCRRFPIVKSL
jgi:glycine hydroxymethyltransferase